MSYEMQREEDLNSEGWPLDWDTESNFRGLSRATSQRRYHVRLSVVGKQFFIASAASQLKGARLYDLTLWKLAAFIPRIHPNFPQDFSNLTQAHVEQGCPILNFIYSQVVAATGPHGDATEREMREGALERMNQSKQIHVAGTVSGYGRYSSTVERLRAQLILLVSKVKTARLTINFAKLPELQRCAAEYEQLLNQTDEKGRELQSLLTNHESFYKKLLDNESTAI